MFIFYKRISFNFDHSAWLVYDLICDSLSMMDILVNFFIIEEGENDEE